MSHLTNNPQEYLLLCLSSATEQQKAARLEQLSPAEWMEILKLANQHNVTPLLAWRLGALPGDLALPQDVRQALRMSSLQSASRNLVLYHQLGKVLQAMQKEGLETIALKGAHLAELVYADSALRSMSDVDLMVRRQDLERAREILSQLGYAATRRFQTEREAAKHLHLPPFHKPGAIIIELHWTVAPPIAPMQVQDGELWDSARPAVIAGVPTQVLSPEDLLLHLCLHFCQHEFKLGLRHLCDILAILESPECQMDWQAFVARAEGWQAGKCAFLTLRLAQNLLGAPIPMEVLQALQPADFTPQIEQMARSRLLGSAATPSMHPDLAGLLGKRPLRNRLQPFLSSLFPPPEYIAQRYTLPENSKRVYLFYFVRLKDLLHEYGWQLAGMLRGDQTAREIIQQENLLTDWWMSTYKEGS